MNRPGAKKLRYNSATGLKFLHAGDEYFNALLEIIHGAREIILLQVYAIDPDETGETVIKALEEAVIRGVQVFVLVDAYGSKALGIKGIKRMRNAGIHCRRFSPFVFSKFRAGRRLHHKILVADGEVAIVGGINISDKYHGTQDELPWVDFGIRVSGPVCLDLIKICKTLYYPDRMPQFPKLSVRYTEKGAYRVAAVHSDWFRRKNKINYHFKQAIRHSQKEIIIICSYFLPSFRLLRLISKALERGITIHLFLQGKSDVPLARNATRYFYRIFFQHNIKIYEFPERVLHAKFWMVDEEILSVGSYNFNHLSEYTSIETNLEICNEGFATEVKEELKGLFKEYAVPVDEEMYVRKMGLFHRVTLWSSYTITTMLMKLAFAFTSKRIT